MAIFIESSAMDTRPKSDRRSSCRQYLMQPVYAEILFGRRKVSIETGRIGDISAHGLGVCPATPLALEPHTPITLAANIDQTVVSVSGQVVSSNYGHIGIRVSDAQQDALQTILNTYSDRTVVSPPIDGVSHIKGMLSMYARFPIHWAIDQGARRFDLSEVTRMDSSGIGLMLMLGERYGIRIENCSSRVCQLMNLCRTPVTCGNCRRP